MDSTGNVPEDSLGDGVTVTAGFDEETFRLRTYQAEMVEKSIHENIIVAMDTGSGKTHIALARTAAELERCLPHQMVWFLAPTVTLCEQQFAVFQEALPAYCAKLLSGKDGVDHWTDQAIWDAVLQNVRIVLSTHAILLDALTHAFVKMDMLALLIFDEAHHCTLNHPANQIMGNFYSNIVSRPSILGLSASPVMRAKANRSGLEQIEKNLNSVTKSPKVHRSELIRFVHRPELLKVPYFGMHPLQLPLLDALLRAHGNYDIETDPYVVQLLQRQREGHDNSRSLQKVFMSGKTYCTEQLKKFASKAEAMYEEMGPSAADWYIHQCIWKFENMIRGSDVQLNDWTSREKDHLLKILKSLPLLEDRGSSMSLDRLSPKVQRLIDVLMSEATTEVTGLVFVEQRVWVAALAEILSMHPQTRDRFSFGTFVGTSQSSKRKSNLADLVEVRNEDETLDDFRTGKKNIILTTSVLEEGIDISSCHLVICFERPKNLKSFIQRRGRARKQKSKYLIFQPETDERSPEIWESLEDEMKKAYLDDLRQVQEAEETELTEEHGEMFYRIPSTGALLTLDNAFPHLSHFCSLLGTGPFIDSRPQFSFNRGDTTGDFLITAEVMLPISVDPSLRKARSLHSWVTERMAKKDAAFQAYKALHLAGLINDNLLPDRQEEDDMMQKFQIPDHRPSLVPVSPPFDPWEAVAKHQQQDPHTYYRTLLTIETNGEDPFQIMLLTPIPMPKMPAFTLHWSEKVQYTVQASWLQGAVFTEDELLTLRSITRKILQSMHHGRMQGERHDFLWLLAPSNFQHPVWDQGMLENFDTSVSGSQSAMELIRTKSVGLSNWGLVSMQGDLRKFILKDISSTTVESGASEVTHELQVIRAPKRRDFLHRVSGDHENKAYTRTEILNAADCITEMLPAPYSIFSLFLPSILWKYQVFMMADTLRTTLLAPVSFEVAQLPLLLQALTSSAASEETNYQRLEFLGDCILKFIASVHLMAANLTWPESFLTGKKGKIVSNGFLARATMKAGLDKFVVNKKFTGAKWAPRYAGDVLKPQAPEEKVMRSSKLIADVIESLIGASYVKGGFSDAFACVRTLLTMENWTPIPEANSKLFNAAPIDISFTNLATLETLIGHTFTKKALLLEAITHASYNGPNANCSYERLEFLGDAVLDYIISRRLFEHKLELSHQKMHAMRSAMANASFLAFRMFETTLEETITNTSTMKPEPVYRALWQFMRQNRPHIISSRDLALQQHNEARAQILDALQHDDRFPWHLLSLTDVPKFLSDIVESVIGGIYIDSQGSIAACEVFVSKLGILDTLERILRDGVDCLHPKERLGHLAVERSVQYVKIEEKEEQGDRKKNSNGNGNTKKPHKVQVRVGGEYVGGPVEGLKRLNAETIAAWKAVGILEKGKDRDGDVDMELSSDDEWHDANETGGIALDGTS